MSFVARYQELLHKVEQAVDDTLANEAAETVKDIMEEKLDSVVYSYAATPEAMSKRRMANGGLLARANMISRVEDEHTLVVENVAPLQGSPAGRALSDVVNDGDANYKQPRARQFVQSTEQEAAASGRVLSELLNGLKRRGL